MIFFYFREVYKSIIAAKLSFILSHISTVLSVFLTSLAIFSFDISDYFENDIKSRIEFNVFIVDSASQNQIEKIKNHLDKFEIINEVRFVSKEQAASDFIKQTGENFSELLEFNPLPSSFIVKFKPEFVELDSLSYYKREISKISDVDDVVYRAEFVYRIINQIYSIKNYLLIFAIILVLIAVYIIYSTNRLIIESKVDQIETMKLVGAKLSSIKFPIYLFGINLGILASVINMGIFLSIFYMFGRNAFLEQLSDLTKIIYIAIIFICGITLGFVGSFLSAKNITLKIKR